MKKTIYLASLVFGLAVLLFSQTSPVHAEECSYINSYIKVAAENDSADVVRLQQFLNSVDGEKLALSGKYDLATINAVERFQLKYASEILAPWGINYATGQVFVTTRHKINEIYCSVKKPYSPAERALLGTTSTVKATSDVSPSKPATSPLPISITPTRTSAPSVSPVASAFGTTTFGDDETAASARTSIGERLRAVFSSSITLLVLLILLAIVIYAMVTKKNEEPGKNQQNKK